MTGSDHLPRRRFGLSKSKITMFEQCPKRLWLSVHRPDLAEQDEGAEARFAIGHEVGGVACALLPDGVMVEAEPDLAAALATTQDLFDGGYDRPIFEATLQHDGVLVRIDVLEPDGAGGWRMAEVKSSTKEGLPSRRSRHPAMGRAERGRADQQRGDPAHRQQLRPQTRG